MITTVHHAIGVRVPRPRGEHVPTQSQTIVINIVQPRSLKLPILTKQIHKCNVNVAINNTVKRKYCGKTDSECVKGICMEMTP